MSLILIHPMTDLRLGKKGHIYLESRVDPGGRLGRSPPLKPTKVTLFTMILYSSENSIRDKRPFCRPLFCHTHSSVVTCISFLLQQCTRNENWLSDITEIAP